jgi:hypothetical protein
MRRKTKRLIIVLSGVAVLVAAAAVTVFVWKPWEPVYVASPDSYQHTIGRGNLPGNDLVAEEGDWIYSVNKAGDGNIYRKSKDGTKNELIVDDMGWSGVTSANLQIWDGWLYFKHFGKDCVARVRLDGSKKEMLSSTEQLGSFWKLSIVDGVIYAADRIDYGLYRMDLDGKNLKILVRESAPDYFIEGKWIYYQYIPGSSAIREGGIYKRAIDGMEDQLCSQHMGEEYARLFVADGWLYYIDSDFYLCKQPTDDGEKIQMLDEKTEGLSYIDGYLYFTFSGGIGINRMRLDGTELIQILDGEGILYPQYADGWIYYYLYEKGNSLLGTDNEMYRIREDGTDNQKVTFIP